MLLYFLLNVCVLMFLKKKENMLEISIKIIELACAFSAPYDASESWQAERLPVLKI